MRLEWPHRWLEVSHMMSTSLRLIVVLTLVFNYAAIIATSELRTKYDLHLAGLYPITSADPEGEYVYHISQLAMQMVNEMDILENYSFVLDAYDSKVSCVSVVMFCPCVNHLILDLLCYILLTGRRVTL